MLVENILAPMGSFQQDSDHRGYRVYNQSDLVAGNQCTGVDNQSMDPDYMLARFEQSMDLAAKYRCSWVVECNNGNLRAGYKLVEMDLENSNCLGVERAAGRWDPAEPDN